MMPVSKGGPRRRAGPGRSEGGGEIGLGSLFKGLGDFVDMLGQMVEAGEQQAEHSGEFRIKGLGEKAHGVYGVSVRVGLGGAQLERFGNIRATPQGPEVVNVREPLIDVFDEEREIVVAAELPGASDAEIAVEIRGDVLALESSGERRYAKEVLLPAAVDPQSLQRSFKNGLLELRLKKA